MSLIKTTKDNKYFGKKWNFETNSMLVLGVLGAMMLVLVYFIYLNYSAIGNVIQQHTSIHPIVGIVLLFALTYVIKKSSENFGKYISQTIWITMGMLGMYWVLTTSDWAIYEKATLVICHIIAYLNIIMNTFSSDK